MAVAFVLLAFHQRWPPQSTPKGTLSLREQNSEALPRQRYEAECPAAFTRSRGSALGVGFLCDMGWGLMLCIA